MIYFSTCTIDNWKPIFLLYPETNFVILESLSFLVNIKKCQILAFVIMPNHFHLVWRTSGEPKEYLDQIKSYSAKRILEILKNSEADSDQFLSPRRDRKHKLWKGNSHHLHLTHPEIINQKILYTHLNPTRGKYASVIHQADYIFSSAASYFDQQPRFSFLTLFNSFSPISGGTLGHAPRESSRVGFG